MKRREFLLGSAAAVGASRGGAAFAQARPARMLEMAPLLDATASGRLALTAQYGLTRFRSGAPTTATAGFDQPYLGPTLRVRNGPLAVEVGSSRVDLQACKLEYSIVSPK